MANSNRFTHEDALRYLPKDAEVYDPETKQHSLIPLDPKFPRNRSVQIGEEQLKYTVGLVWPTMYCMRRIVVAQDHAVTYSCGGIYIVGDRDPSHQGPGHILFLGNPGTGKTLLANVPYRLFQAKFGRLQAMADSTPSDYTGTRFISYDENPVGEELEDEIRVLAADNKSMAQMLRIVVSAMHKANPRANFRYVPGPGHAQIQLIDEINRGPEKMQSGVLEQMSEGQVTQFGKTYPVNGWVIGTMNPRESRGVVPLGRALLDRIMFTVVSNRFKEGDRAKILRRTQHMQEIKLPVLGKWEDVERARKYFHDNIKISYEMQELIDWTLARTQEPWKFPGVLAELARDPKTHVLPTEVFTGTDREEFITAAIEGRGTTHLEGAARIMAVLNYRSYVTRDDILKVMPYVCSHRLEFTPTVIQRYMRVRGIKLPEVGQRMLASDLLSASYADALRAMADKRG